MYKNSHNNNNTINKPALILSSFVHIVLLLFLFWNIQWKNNQNTLKTIEVELYNEIPGNAETQKAIKAPEPKIQNLQSPKNEVKKVIESKKIPQNLVEETPEVVDDRKADIELQRQKELRKEKERLEKLEKQKLLEQQKLEQEKLEKQRLEKEKKEKLEKQKLLEQQRLEKEKLEQEKQKQKELEKQKLAKEKAKKEVKKDIPKFDFRDGIDKDIEDSKNQKAIVADKNRDGNINDKTRGGVGNVTGKNVAGNTMKKVKARNLDAYIAKIQNIVRSKVVLPPNVEGNPEMLLTVRQSQNGTILSVKITRSSGNELLDKAVVAAFNKSSPLPLPDDPDDFENILNVKYRPFN